MYYNNTAKALNSCLGDLSHPRVIYSCRGRKPLRQNCEIIWLNLCVLFLNSVLSLKHFQTIPTNSGQFNICCPWKKQQHIWWVETWPHSISLLWYSTTSDYVAKASLAQTENFCNFVPLALRGRKPTILQISWLAACSCVASSVQNLQLGNTSAHTDSLSHTVYILKLK